MSTWAVSPPVSVSWTLVKPLWTRWKHLAPQRVLETAWRYGTVIRHDADSFGRAHRVAVYPAVYRIRPLADPEVAYAASGIASWRASTTSDCPSTETATFPPD